MKVSFQLSVFAPQSSSAKSAGLDLGDVVTRQNVTPVVVKDEALVLMPRERFKQGLRNDFSRLHDRAYQ